MQGRGEVWRCGGVKHIMDEVEEYYTLLNNQLFVGSGWNIYVMNKEERKN